MRVTHFRWMPASRWTVWAQIEGLPRSLDEETRSLYTTHMPSHDVVTSVDTSSVSSMAKRVRAELQPSRLFPTLTAGFVVGLIVVNVAISVATLVFQGELQQFLAQGIGLALFSGVLVKGTTTRTQAPYPLQMPACDIDCSL